MSFGDTTATTDTYGTWRDLPSADVVYGWLKQRAILQARVRSMLLEVTMEEARITIRKPRDKAVRVVGIEGTDDNHTPYIVELRRELSAVQAELDDIEAEIKMFEFRRDVFRSLSFRERV